MDNNIMSYHLSQSNQTEELTKKFLYARETEQRVHTDLINRDIKLISEFHKTVMDIDAVFKEISGKLQTVIGKNNMSNLRAYINYLF